MFGLARPAIRTPSERELAAVSRLFARIPNTPDWSPEELADLVEDGALVVFAPRTGAALAHLATDEADLYAVGVLAERRGRGWGKELLRRLEEEAAVRGAISMHLDVAETNAPARALYQGCGYRETGRRGRYYRDGAAAILMAKCLASLHQ